jgi:predicted RNase H-like nuclease (RuvC/YqgF family)
MNWKEQVEAAAEEYTKKEWGMLSGMNEVVYGNSLEGFISGAIWEKERAEIQADSDWKTVMRYRRIKKNYEQEIEKLKYENHQLREQIQAAALPVKEEEESLLSKIIKDVKGETDWQPLLEPPVKEEPQTEDVTKNPE